MLDLPLPSHFPAANYSVVRDKAHQMFERRGTEEMVRSAFREAWSSILYRFASCDEHGQRFSTLLSEYGAGPPPIQRYAQERDFFDFVVLGLACIEAYHYALFALGSCTGDPRFRFSSATDRRRVNLSRTKDAILAAFPGRAVSIALQVLAPE